MPNMKLINSDKAFNSYQAKFRRPEDITQTFEGTWSSLI